MIFLDSWVWLEFVLGGADSDDAEAVIERANTAGEGGLIAPTVLTEVAYRVHEVDGEGSATDVVSAIRDFPHVDCLPLVADVAVYAAELRAKYYEPGDRELSYADAIHLATAAVHDDCHTLYSGDPDFRGTDEVDVVVL